MNKACNERREAVDILAKFEKRDAYVSIELDHRLRAHPEWSPREKSLITKLVYTVLTNDLRILCMIDLYSRTPSAGMDPFIRRVLMVSVAQLLWMDRIPPSAVVNEAVELVKHSRLKHLAGFVNSVLRAMLRDHLRESWPEASEDPIGHWSVRTSMPRWILELWQQNYGFERMKSLAAAMNQPRPVSIRCNLLRTDPEQLRVTLSGRWDPERVRPGLYLAEALQLDGVGGIEEDPAFRDGLYTVQDESSMMAVRTLDPQPGERVLDLCAAPGGKSTQMAERMGNHGEVRSRDLYEQKCSLIAQNARRLGTDIVHPEVADALERRPEDAGAFDRVLLDAPCSGLGVLRNKPDMKRRRSPGDIAELAGLQYRLMQNAAEAVRPGGVLVYSTCTLSSEENERNVERFLEEHAGFRLQSPAPWLPDSYPAERHGTFGTYVFPEKNGMDGFFFARMVRLG